MTDCLIKCIQYSTVNNNSDQFTWHIDSDTPTWREDITAKLIEEVTDRTRTEDCEPPAAEPKDMCQITDDDNELNEDNEFDWSLNEPESLNRHLKPEKQVCRFAMLSRSKSSIFLHVVEDEQCGVMDKWCTSGLRRVRRDRSITRGGLDADQ